jgi:hypothetical protein
LDKHDQDRWQRLQDLMAAGDPESLQKASDLMFWMTAKMRVQTKRIKRNERRRTALSSVDPEFPDSNR